MKKVLFFMPDNPLKRNAGNKIRALSFLKYFKSRGYEIDFVSEYYWGEWTQLAIEEFKNAKLADHTSVLHRKPSKNNILYYFLFYKLPNFFYQRKWGILPVNFPEMVTYKLRKAFNQLLKNNKYDYIFINYASWSSLIENNALIGNAITVLDTHDLLTAQNQHKYNLGSLFQEEIRRLSLFDKVLAISIEEQYIFSQFCKLQVDLVPMMMERPAIFKTPVAERKFDLIYVASKNPHNIEAANWFMTHVYPLLPTNIEICIIGQITEYIVKGNSNITIIPFAESLEIYYQQAKIAICPMLTGTGTKIKVIEALSHLLPVVCNKRGIDGLINKSDNGCLVSDIPEEFAKHILSLLNDPKTYEEQSLFAQTTYESNYEMGNCYKSLDLLF